MLAVGLALTVFATGCSGSRGRSGAAPRPGSLTSGTSPTASPSLGAGPSASPEGVPNRSPTPVASSQLACSTDPPAKGPGAAVARLGEVSARLSWARQGDPGTSYMGGARIQLTRAGLTLLDATVTEPSPVNGTSAEWEKGWETLETVCVEVPASALPRMHLTGYALGMTCCRAARSHYPRPDGTYATLDRNLGRGEGTFELADGRVVLVASDPDFHSRFDCAACSVGPLQVWALEDGRHIDVTRQFPDRIATEAAGWWELIGARDPAPLGLVAPWVADQCQLGKKASAYAVLDGLNAAGKLRFPDEGSPPRWHEGSEYVSALKSFLMTEGYCR